MFVFFNDLYVQILFTIQLYKYHIYLSICKYLLRFISYDDDGDGGDKDDDDDDDDDGDDDDDDNKIIK